MKYLDNLIAWGDYLFQKDSIEYINEATNIYVLASKILGREPVLLKNEQVTDQCFNSLSKLADKIIEVEENFVETESITEKLNKGIIKEFNYAETINKVAAKSVAEVSTLLDFTPTHELLTLSDEDNFIYESTTETVQTIETIQPQSLPTEAITDLSNSESTDSINSLFYFCIPGNSKMNAYWSTVGDRLFKIRHCQNISGVERQLALFEAPIDPALLIKALANGVDLSAAISDLSAPNPLYRFRFILQKALELTADVKSLGQSFLSALEKKDAEELSLIRAGHEITLLDAITSLKIYNIEEAEKNI